MIVDDERPCLEELEYLLKGYSDIVVTGSYANPLEALSAVESSMPDAVFLDIGMPHISGIDLAERIHDLDDTVRVVFVTAHSKHLKEIKKAHPFECLLKPVNEARLNTIVELLRKRQKQAPLWMGIHR